MNDLSELAQDPWKGDLFDREAEGQMLAAYIASIGQRRVSREDARAFTLAVDAGYGEGKTFFLKRLAAHLSLNHPVAFVDAWTDDLQDDPLTALAATLTSALKAHTPSAPRVKQRLQRVLKAAGKVTALTVGGLATKAAGVFLTDAIAAKAIDAARELGADAENVARESLEGIGDSIVDHTAASLKAGGPGKLMRERIAAFESGKSAIREMKESLIALTRALNDTDVSLPIVIVIDELDRCRPTYAIKLLEEIKQLFDVPGLVFVFGMHGEQLAFAVNGAYGDRYDGSAYLRRFINRRYRLTSPDLSKLVKANIASHGIDPARLRFEPVSYPTGAYQDMPTHELFARYLHLYEANARDTFQVMDVLQTCCAITGNLPLLMPYLLPLIILHVRGKPLSDIVDKPPVSNLSYGYRSHEGRPTNILLEKYAADLFKVAHEKDEDVASRYNRGGANIATVRVFDYRGHAKAAGISLGEPSRYVELLGVVGRFASPALEEAGPT